MASGLLLEQFETFSVSFPGCLGVFFAAAHAVLFFLHSSYLSLSLSLGIIYQLFFFTFTLSGYDVLVLT